MSRTRTVTLIAAVATVWCTAPASASTLSARPDPKNPGYQTFADYDAAPGEANRVLVTRVTDHVIRIADSGAEIRVGQGCRSLDPHTAECASPGSNGQGPNWFLTARVRAGDGADEIRSAGVGLDADGGPGDDVIEAGTVVASRLDGGGGRDRLIGGDNADTLSDGDTSGAADVDVLDGRGDRDTVSYAGRTARVTVDLARLSAGGGEAGERDTLISVESAEGGGAADVLRANRDGSSLDGGPAADRLVGSAGPDFISGGRGDDSIAGAGGDDYVDGEGGDDTASGGRGSDQLDGGAGRDRLDGGAGRDWLVSGTAFCGPGPDTVAPSARDDVDRSCELLRFALPFRGESGDLKGVEARPYPRRGRSALVFRVRCPYTETDGYPNGLELRGRVTVSARDGRVVATGPIPSAGRACNSADPEDASELPWISVRAPLTAAGRQGGARGDRLTVRFTGRNVPPVPWRISRR
jgi:Ca2+-binding RTX toxin-like protein